MGLSCFQSSELGKEFEFRKDSPILRFIPIWPPLAIMSSDGKDEEVIAEIRMLEKEVLSSLEKVNSLAALLKHLRVRTEMSFRDIFPSKQSTTSIEMPIEAKLTHLSPPWSDLFVFFRVKATRSFSRL